MVNFKIEQASFNIKMILESIVFRLCTKPTVELVNEGNQTKYTLLQNGSHANVLLYFIQN